MSFYSGIDLHSNNHVVVVISFYQASFYQATHNKIIPSQLLPSHP
ncbi:hypothetical protein GARC_4198 [Paraglaciecola arctica BSs20135]|uniref:Uncharacterized protein n=1 Tax=Paraglaciecola arctica BSs20135 TaxID=493475 RepID=K6ZCI2_9ALTE|nr:hypothetical protein GARC_4198 [Paraglaciecola arctica BSs20135]